MPSAEGVIVTLCPLRETCAQAQLHSAPADGLQFGASAHNTARLSGLLGHLMTFHTKMGIQVGTRDAASLADGGHQPPPAR